MSLGTHETLVGDTRGGRRGQAVFASVPHGKREDEKLLKVMIFWKRVKQAINDLWYPRSVTIGKPVETQELGERLARESTVSPADTHAVIRALPKVMADFMKESRAVHLEGLGWFRYTALSGGNGVATKEEVSSDQITGLRVQFTSERKRNMSGGYTRSLIAEDGIVFMEWLGKESDETELPDDTEEEGGEIEDGPQVQ